MKLKYKRGDSCHIKKASKFVEGSIVKLAMPYHGSSYYTKGDTRYFVTEKKTIRISAKDLLLGKYENCLLYTSPSPRDRQKSRMPSSA